MGQSTPAPLRLPSPPPANTTTQLTARIHDTTVEAPTATLAPYPNAPLPRTLSA